MKIHALSVVPALPRRIAALHQLAYNLWWSWNHEAADLFSRIDPDLWLAVAGNPVRLLGSVGAKRLAQLALDRSFVEQLESVSSKLQQYMANPRPGSWDKATGVGGQLIAYFSPEFGLTQSVPLYAGGLGILAGDHLKAASDVGLPLVGIGLLYREGYFVQYLNADGWQQERYPRNDFSKMPITPVTAPGGSRLRVLLEYPGSPVTAQLWKAQVGKVPLYLLDTDIEDNRQEDRKITAQLYGGDPAMRLKQEILLGIGGMRALTAMGITPSVCHMNEGHSALQAIERARILIERYGISFAEAREAVAAGTVFTTHTPVPAGNDVFQPDLVEEYLKPFRKAVGLSREEFLALGRQRPEDEAEPFAMPVLALRLASHRNGVSRLHGQVSRRMWKALWPAVPEDEIPIKHVTNAVHLSSWISSDLANLYDRYLGPAWRSRASDSSVWTGIDRLPDAELWRMHQRLKQRTVAFARARVKKQLEERGAQPAEVEAVGQLFDPGALTICFARRSATYKRGWLLFSDPERLAKILNDPERPVQIIFAGKAHPADCDGKEIIQTIVHKSREEAFRRRVAFLEDYDIDMARWLLHGVDVWVNNPRRPLEACGTSGMKAAINGAVNVSIPDGWWAEAYRPEIGWNIGAGEDYSDFDYQDEVEAGALYEILEQEIVPCFYLRDDEGMPRRWLEFMKASMRIVSPQFNTDRMLSDYTNMFYLPAACRWNDLTQHGLARSRALASWKKHIEKNWNQVRIVSVESPATQQVSVGEELTVRARVQLGAIQPTEVLAELYFGESDGNSGISAPSTAAMHLEQSDEDGTHSFVCTIPCRRSGQLGYTVRLRPSHPDLSTAHETTLMAWE